MTITLNEPIDQSADNSTLGCTGIVCLGQVELKKAFLYLGSR